MRRVASLFVVLGITSCLEIGSGSTGSEGSESQSTACGTEAGMVSGAVYYWALPDSPDSLPAESVDVLLTQGGPTYRVQTSAAGTFSAELPPGEWGLAPDVHTGCAEETVEVIEIEACETTEVELVVPLCAG